MSARNAAVRAVAEALANGGTVEDEIDAAVDALAALATSADVRAGLLDVAEQCIGRRRAEMTVDAVLAALGGGE